MMIQWNRKCENWNHARSMSNRPCRFASQYDSLWMKSLPVSFPQIRTFGMKTSLRSCLITRNHIENQSKHSSAHLLSVISSWIFSRFCTFYPPLPWSQLFDWIFFDSKFNGTTRITARSPYNKRPTTEICIWYTNYIKLSFKQLIN